MVSKLKFNNCGTIAILRFIKSTAKPQKKKMGNQSHIKKCTQKYVKFV